MYFGLSKHERWGIVNWNSHHQFAIVWLMSDETAKPFGKNLLDQTSREKLPPLYSNEQLGLMAIALVKFFTPDSNWTWYVSEFDGDNTFFGLVAGFDVELGYFLLSELQSIRGPLGLLVERDLHFEPKTLKALFEEHGKAIRD